MNWYKKANKENFPAWLSQCLIKETEGYKHFKNRTYPGHTFLMKNIQLVEDWINETNPDFESLSLYDAIKTAKTYYENKKLPLKLSPNDINKHNLTLALIDGYNDFMITNEQVQTDTITVKSIRSVYPDVSKLRTNNIYNYSVTIEYNIIKEGELEKRNARFVTKDGKYFSLSEISDNELV